MRPCAQHAHLVLPRYVLLKFLFKLDGFAFGNDKLRISCAVCHCQKQ